MGSPVTLNAGSKLVAYESHHHRRHCGRDETVNTVRKCRLFARNYALEMKEIELSVFALLERVSDIIAETDSSLRFTPVLSGSTAEDTKVYLPN